MTMPLIRDWIPTIDPAPELARPLIANTRRQQLVALRIFTLLALIVLLNFADLLFTLSAHTAGLLIEMNPLAASLFRGHMVFDVVLLKFGAVTTSCAILWRLRYARWTVPACWFLVAIYTALACMWIVWSAHYYDAMQSRIAWNSLAVGS